MTDKNWLHSNGSVMNTRRSRSEEMPRVFQWTYEGVEMSVGIYSIVICSSVDAIRDCSSIGDMEIQTPP